MEAFYPISFDYFPLNIDDYGDDNEDFATGNGDADTDIHVDYNNNHDISY